MKNYEIIQQIYESDNSLVYQAILQPNNQPIILKILKENYPTPSELTRYKQEYEITRSLNTDGVIKAYNLQRYQNSLMMFLEDFGGKSLKLLMTEHQFTLEEFLTISIKTTESLESIHTNNIIHKDINPSNIVYNRETRQLKIIDFGISTRLSQENQTVRNPNQLEGTLAYIAPEQTGRMNRGIDYRSDFYSLGITFYELLTNKLPFETNDPMELLHCHIAQQPKPPYKVISSIPLIVSNIVMKLLAKSPEERYQSAWGLKMDLESCLYQLQTQGQISSFSLGHQDISSKFQIPQKLYGREQEVEQLLTTFERVSQETSEIILVSGYSGIGKSALVNEIQKAIFRQQGYFISGKFDQLKRDIPYAGFSRAFQNLIRQLLGEPEAALQTWKQRILEALGPNGQVIIDVIPEVEKIIGKQPPVEELGATEAQNRFNFFFQKFISIFSKKEHPLVIFLDDLQWADLPSLKLIELLISDPNSQYLLMIGAYRDNEVSPTHPLIQTLEQIQKAGTKVNQITLQPLGINQINQLIADTLSCSTEESISLAELLNTKTQGNPFFLTQLFQSLYQEKLLLFDANLACWHWNIEQIKEIEIADNVIDLMTNKIEKLDKKTQKVLKLAACIGNQFNLEVLSIVNKKSQTATAKELQEALQEGLVLPLNSNYKDPLLWSHKELSPTFIPYKFLHDRVQQAAYSIIRESEKKQLHLQVGRLLLKNTKEDDIEENLFEIVNQLNEGAELIYEQLEKTQLAKLNLNVGKKAKASIAYEPALRYLEAGLALLSKNSWQDEYKLTLELYVETLEVIYLNTKFEQIEELSATVLHFCKDTLDKIKVYQVKIRAYFAQFQQQKAIDNAIEALTELGINLPSETSEIEKSISQELTFLELFLKEREIEDLFNLEPMSDQYKIAAISIFQQIVPSTVLINFSLYILIVLIQLNLCIKYGNSSSSVNIYILYGMILVGVMRDFDSGYKFGKLSLKFLKQSNFSKSEALVMHVYYGFIWHWKESIRNIVADEKLLEGFQKGINTGNNEFASYASISYCLINFFKGNTLEDVQCAYIKYEKLIQIIKQTYSIFYIQICKSITSNLLDHNSDKDFLIVGKSQKEEDEYLKRWEETNNDWLLFIFHLAKTISYFFFKNYEKALEHGIKAEKNLKSCAGYLPEPQQNFYYSLALLACYANRDVSQQKQLLEQIEINQNNMKTWAKHCPENFQNKYDLIEAEKARILGQPWQAGELYEKAIQGAKQYEFIHEEALAYEHAAEFYLSIGREEVGNFYLKNAHYCYISWGAKAKVKDLEAEYAQLQVGATSRTEAKGISTTISTTGSNGKVLDLTTVIKASQALASEIVLEKLLEKLMKISIENAGAQRGFLILEKEGNWVIEAEGAMDDDNITTLRSLTIDSVDIAQQLPLVSTTIVNYVAHSQQNVVLNDAEHEGQFITDPYVVAVQPKSILCIPLLHQGKLSGILYLENNLITHTFTPERIEILKILSAQAAISIENSRLYQQLEDYNRTLEQKVEERNKELLKTLEELKITQEKLRFENDLLKSSEQLSTYDYQIGGSLPMDAPTYVVRSADRHLYKALRHSEFCYILNARQMGKSSLMVRMMHHLQQEGFSCTAIDLTRIGSDNITPAQWYLGLAVELWQNFDLLDKVNLPAWWNEYKDLSPTQKLSQFIENILLKQVQSEKIYIFVDEIDSVLGLNFSVNDFFALMRFCYNQRSINQEYRRLTFAFFGVATPSDLISDYKRTPFNIGQSIQLEGFKEDEVYPLGEGLKEKVSDAIAIRKVIREILHWTNGQPFLTQKLCQLIRNSSSPIPANSEAEWIENLVQTNVLNNWESQDEPEHLRTIRDRILNTDLQVNHLLELYQQILQQGEIRSVDSPEEKELILSGIIIKQQGSLQVHSRIYKLIFDQSWIDLHISQ